MSDPFHLATDQAARITELTDRIAALEAQLAKQDAAIRKAMANEEEMITFDIKSNSFTNHGSTWHILNAALPPPPKEAL